MDVDSSDKAGEDVIDESVRYKGTVKDFNSRRGFGYIIPEGKTEDDKVFAHWRQIESSDEWPQLKEGQVVEYYLGKKENGKRKSQQRFAAKITLEGGNPVTVAIERNYPNRQQRFQGKVKFFDARKGFGFIRPSADFDFDGSSFKASEAKIYIAREDIKTDADIAPNLKDDADCEFTLYKSTEKEGYGAGDVTKVGGDVFNEDDFATKKTGWPKKRFKNRGGGGFGPMKGGGGMNMGGMMGGQMFMMNGMPYMMMPVGGGGGGGKRWGNKKKSW